jgi:hypothetical protein
MQVHGVRRTGWQTSGRYWFAAGVTTTWALTDSPTAIRRGRIGVRAALGLTAGSTRQTTEYIHVR